MKFTKNGKFDGLNRTRFLIKCDDAEFDDCIRCDRHCYDLARELEDKNKLSTNKIKLLAQRKREHMMVEMFGQRWWKKKK
jgi:hypothetical protein